MAQNDVTIRMNAKQANVVQAWLSATRSVGQFEKQVAKTGRTSNKAGKQGAMGFGQMFKTLGPTVAKLSAMGAGLGLVSAGIRSVTRDIQAQRRIGKDAIEKKKSLGEQLESIIIPPGANIGIKEIGDLIRRTSTGMSKAETARVVKSAISGGSGPDVRGRVMTGLEAAKDLAPFGVESTDALVQQLVRAKSIHGGSTKQRIGTLLAAASNSPSADPVQFAQGVIAGSNALSGFGLTEDQSIPLINAISGRVGDVPTRSSRNASTRMIEQIIRAFQARGVDVGVKDGGRLLTRIMTQDDKLTNAVRGDLLGGFDKERREKILAEGGDPSKSALKGTLSTEAKVLVGILELLKKGDNETKQLFAIGKRDIPFGKKAEAFIDARNKANQSDPSIAVAQIERKMMDLDESAATPGRAMRERLRQFVETRRQKFAGKVGMSAALDFMESVSTSLDSMNDDDLVSNMLALQAKAKRTASELVPRDQIKQTFNSGIGGGPGPQMNPLVPSQAEIAEFAKGNSDTAQMARAMGELVDLTKVLVREAMKRDKHHLTPEAMEPPMRRIGRK